MERAKPELFVLANCANCDKVLKHVDEKHIPVTKRFVNEEPALRDELSRECGKVDLPCMREGGRFIYGPDQIITELDKLCATCSR